MKKLAGYKIAIFVLSLLVIIEAVFILTLTKPKKTAKPSGIKGKIAIVLDDWGYNLNNLNAIEEIKYPITASILPGLSYSRTIASQLDNRGIEVILHLPMEPHEKFNLEKNTLLASMEEQAIKDILARDLEDIYCAKGVSNHMGSRATEDYRVMSIVFGELKKRNLFFLDSFVSAKTVCPALARKMRLGFAKRDIFLDNKEEYNYIKKQLYQLKAKARAYGRAIGIGHDRKVTLEVLRDVMPQFEKEGYKFVFLSDLIK